MTGLDKLQIIEDFFKQTIWFQECGEGVRLVGASLKIEPTGMLLILRGISAEGPLVAFVGGRGLEEIWRKVNTSEKCKSLKWRTDHFALDKK